MKTKNWTNRILWIVLGVMVASLLSVATHSRSEPLPDYCQQEIAALKQRVAALEQYNRNREKADAEEAKRARQEQQSRDRAFSYR